MTALVPSPDTLLALAATAVAAAFLVRRGLRFVRGRDRDACACPSSSACGRGGPSLDELRAAAARGASRVNRGSTSVAR